MKKKEEKRKQLRRILLEELRNLMQCQPFHLFYNFQSCCILLRCRFLLVQCHHFQLYIAQRVDFTPVWSLKFEIITKILNSKNNKNTTEKLGKKSSKRERTKRKRKKTTLLSRLSPLWTNISPASIDLFRALFWN